MSLLVQAKTGLAWGVAEPGCGQGRIQLQADLQLFPLQPSSDCVACSSRWAWRSVEEPAVERGVFGGSGPCE